MKQEGYTKIFIREQVEEGVVKEKEVWVKFEEARDNIFKSSSQLLAEVKEKVEKLRDKEEYLGNYKLDQVLDILTEMEE